MPKRRSCWGKLGSVLMFLPAIFYAHLAKANPRGNYTGLASVVSFSDNNTDARFDLYNNRQQYYQQECQMSFEDDLSKHCEAFEPETQEVKLGECSARMAKLSDSDVTDVPVGTKDSKYLLVTANPLCDVKLLKLRQKVRVSIKEYEPDWRVARGSSIYTLKEGSERFLISKISYIRKGQGYPYPYRYSSSYNFNRYIHKVLDNRGEYLKAFDANKNKENANNLLEEELKLSLIAGEVGTDITRENHIYMQFHVLKHNKGPCFINFSDFEHIEESCDIGYFDNDFYLGKKCEGRMYKAGRDFVVTTNLHCILRSVGGNEASIVQGKADYEYLKNKKDYFWVGKVINILSQDDKLEKCIIHTDVENTKGNKMDKILQGLVSSLANVERDVALSGLYRNRIKLENAELLLCRYLLEKRPIGSRRNETEAATYLTVPSAQPLMSKNYYLNKTDLNKA